MGRASGLRSMISTSERMLDRAAGERALGGCGDLLDSVDDRERMSATWIRSEAEGRNWLKRWL